MVTTTVKPEMRTCALCGQKGASDDGLCPECRDKPSDTPDGVLPAIEPHPAAGLFPLLSGRELEELIDDIREHGQIEPAIVFDGMLLDGRNRQAACERIGVPLMTRELEDCPSPTAFVISANLKRRHLTASQRAAAAVEALPMFEAEAKARQREHGKTAPGKTTDETLSAQMREVSGKSSEHSSKAFNVSPRYVEDAKRVQKADPALFEDVKAGRSTISEASRVLKKREVEQALDDIAVKEAKAIEGVYDVIVIDPPWPMKKIDRDVRPNQVEFDYPTLTEEEIAATPPPCAGDCHVWLWTTQRFLPMALRLLDRWGLKYICTFVWHKAGGFQPTGLPQYNCEFALYAHKGSPAFTTTKDFKVCFEAPRGRHSEKPHDFYEMVRRVTAGRRLDMFARIARDGFDVWGNEVGDGETVS